MDLPDEAAGIALLKKIEWCGRISHRSEDAQGEDSWKRFIEAVVIQHGDWSIVEHASVTCDFYVDRGITLELVRHRLFSFTQESTRFVASRIIVTGNLRNWRHFFIMRTTKEAHPQMREVTIPLLAEFQSKIPILFSDIEPLAKQSESMRKGR